MEAVTPFSGGVVDDRCLVILVIALGDTASRNSDGGGATAAREGAATITLRKQARRPA